MGYISDNLSKIRKEMATLSNNTALTAVSKYRSSDEILQAINAGQKIFGENKVQEAIAKFKSLKEKFPDIELHLIGPLQTNKAKEAVALFDVIEVLDRPKLADCLLNEMKKQNKWPDCYIQVNTGAEPQKAGILPQDADNFIEECNQKGLFIKGLMCIPPAGENPDPHFKMLKNIANKHGLKILSMGMSSDYETAIKCGATHVRVGTAIFGEREQSKT